MSEVTYSTDQLELDEIIREVSSWGDDVSFEAEITVEDIAPTEETNETPTSEDAHQQMADDTAPSTEPKEQEKTADHERATHSNPDGSEQTAKEEDRSSEPLDEKAKTHFADFLSDKDADSQKASSQTSGKDERAEPETVRELFAMSYMDFRSWLDGYKDALRLPRIKFSLPRFSMHLPQFKDSDEPIHVPIHELQNHYRREVRTLRNQSFIVGFFAFLLFLMAYLSSINGFIFPTFFANQTLVLYSSLAIFLLALLMCNQILARGIGYVTRRRFGAETLSSLASLFVLVDAVSLGFFSMREYSLPLFAPACLILFSQLWGLYRKQQVLYASCQSVLSSRRADCLTLEYGKQGDKPMYRRREDCPHTFTTQLQQQDGCELIFQFFTPILLLLSVSCAVFASVILERVDFFFYLLSAYFVITCGLSSSICFSLPFYRLARRLRRAGIALAGWTGIHAAKKAANLLVNQRDLFPNGSMQLQSYRLFSGASSDRVISYTASVLRAVGSDLDEVFTSLARIEGSKIVQASAVVMEDDGASAVIDGAQIHVGNSAYMKQKGIYQVPTKLEGEEGIFCAINDRLVGFFGIEYRVHHSVSSALGMLYQSKIVPVLAVLDFNFSTSLFRSNKRFTRNRFSAPGITHRHELLHRDIPERSHLIGFLFRDGLESTTTAIKAATRLQTAVYLSAFLACLSAILGVLLLLFLSLYGSFFTYSAIRILMYLVLWSVPTFLIAFWVDQF